MSQFLTSHEFFINDPNPPKWNPKKNFFDQNIDVLDYYLEEKRKITEGLTVGGYYIHPWLYWHINFFKTPLPTEGKNGTMSEKILNPPLDDNFLYLIENYKEAEEKNLGLIIFGTRGLGKSSSLSSLITWLNTIKANGTTSIIGGSDPDLKAISKLIQVGFNNVNPAMFVPQLISEWDSIVELGVKEKDGFRLPHSHISITNANKGTKKSSEKGAGLSPVGFILDEALHEDSLIPTPTGFITMKDIKVGDTVLDENGNGTLVESKINPGVQDTWKFTFSDYGEVISSGNHRWKVLINSEWKTVTTSEIIKTHFKNGEVLKFPHIVFGTTDLKDITYSGVHQVYCIGVANPTKLFLTKTGVVTKNCGKFECKGVLQSALPSFQTQFGSKLVPILSGTSGNQELTKDAKDILSNPEAFKMLPMNWDRLDRRVDPDSVTWERSKKDKFGTFAPGQMSYRLPVRKVQTNLEEYLGIKNKALANLVVNETNWKAAAEHIKNENAAFKKEEDREKNRMYFPLEIADVFITEASNPFPTAIIDKHVRMLEDTGRIGKAVNLYRDGSELKAEFSGKKRAEVSHGGGEADAPIMVFGEVPTTPPAKFTNVSGLDDYKLELSDTDSLGAFYVIRRRGLSFESPCEVIVASYAGRPFRHSDFHKTCETMLEGWNAICCMEAVDISFKQFLDVKKKAGQCLAPGITFNNSTNSGSYKGNTQYGVYPTAMNKRYMFDLLIDYCKEEHVLGIDDAGNEIVKYGVEYIEDIDLLKEMLSYRKGGNFDRITAFMHALAYARELDKQDVRPKEEKKLKDYFERPMQKVRLSVFGNKRPNAF